VLGRYSLNLRATVRLGNSKILPILVTPDLEFMHSNKIEKYKEKLHLSERQKEILRSLMLGDGHLQSPYRPEIARLQIEYRHAHKEYTDWLYKEFHEWVLTKPKIKSQIVKGKLYQKYYFNTLCHKEIAKIWKKWYWHKKKVLAKDDVKKITPLGLAIWFMDDGSIKSKRHKSFYLNVQDFTEKEVGFPQKLLKKKFGIESSTKLVKRVKTGFQIYISQESAEKFKTTIEPYVLDIMRYKLNSKINKIA